MHLSGAVLTLVLGVALAWEDNALERLRNVRRTEYEHSRTKRAIGGMDLDIEVISNLILQFIRNIGTIDFL